MTSRKPTASTRARSNGRSSARAVISLTTAGRDFVEFHPSMSLENAPTLADCLAMPSQVMASTNTSFQSLSVPDANDATLKSVLADRFHVWTKVTEVIEKMGSVEAYQGDVHALQKLLQLHLLCKQRETHLRTLQLALLQEGRVVPRVEAPTTIVPTETNNEDDKDIDAPNATQVEWQEEQARYLDIVDYDAIDLIELSEQFS